MYWDILSIAAIRHIYPGTYRGLIMVIQQGLYRIFRLLRGSLGGL